MFNEYPYQNNHELNLDWILKKISEFEATFNSWADTIENLQEALEDIEDWEGRISTLENEYNSMLSNLNDISAALDTLSNLHNSDITRLQAEIDSINNELQHIDVDAIYAYINNRNNMIQSDYNNKFYLAYVTMYDLFNNLADRVIALAELVSKIDTTAFNPWPRDLNTKSLQQNLNYAYADLADNVPTAEQYSEAGLTADDYSTFNLFAKDYSLFGNFKLHLDFIYSPVYGFKQNISNVLTSIINYIKGTISADDYTALDLSADDYTALDLSALDYYSFNSQYETLGLGGDGITASQYSTITTI